MENNYKLAAMNEQNQLKKASSNIFQVAILKELVLKQLKKSLILMVITPLMKF